MARTWTSSNPTWQALDPYQKAAAMALMEADGANPDHAKNALGAILNRSAKSGEPLDRHVARAIYQPTIEPAQERRLNSILKNPAHAELTGWAERRSQGLEEDNVAGATHFLAKPSVMLALEAREPGKYKNWGPRGANWTGYDEKTGQYRNQTFADGSHAFLAPEGPHSIPYAGPAGEPGAPVQVASAQPAAETRSTPATSVVASAATPETKAEDKSASSPLGDALKSIFGSDNKVATAQARPEEDPLAMTSGLNTQALSRLAASAQGLARGMPRYSSRPEQQLGAFGNS